MAAASKRSPRRPKRLARGQAMLEYSMLNWVLVVGLLLSSTVRMIPGPKDGMNMNLIEAFLTAYQSYYDSYYFILSLPFP